jgi:hypothetical protein
MLIQGNIIAIMPSDYTDTWGNKYQNITVQTAQGEIEGRKGSKTEYTQNDIGKQIKWVCEKARNKRGEYNKFSMLPDPRYASQDTPQSSPQAAQATNASQSAPQDVEIRKCVTCAFLAIGTRPLIENIEYWMKYIETGIDASLPENKSVENQPEDRRATDEDVPY